MPKPVLEDEIAMAVQTIPINVIARNLDALAERRMKRIAFSIQGKLIHANPVDTGWSRANWLISIGTPPPSPVPSKGVPATSGQSAGQARLLTYKINQGTIWIGNGVPYIQKLNEGHSKQAEAGWVQHAIDAGVRDGEARLG